jgi:hypothetical protein
MNTGTCWGKNTIDPSGRGIEKPSNATLFLSYHEILYLEFPKSA